MEEQMGLDMKTRKKICGRIYKRCQKAGKKEKAKILGEYAPTLGHNRDYLAHLLTNWGKTGYALSDGKPVKYAAKPAAKDRCKASGSKKTGRPEKRHKAFAQALFAIWDFFDFQCGKLLAPLIKGMAGFLAQELSLSSDIQALLLSVSPAAIDRKLRKAKERARLKGIHATKAGTLLKSRIPIRACFGRDGKRPGFFEIDTASHCGARASGQFRQTLTIADAGSGRTQECALLNSAHRWAKERIAQTHDGLPFPMPGIDSDNGGEFINRQLLDWRIQNNAKLTRSRPYRKNDNCFVEQKNGDAVRKNVGYARFESESAFNALSGVCRFLSPLLNCWYPTLRPIAKEKLPSGRHKKIYEKDPKTPCRRLLESPDISEECKDGLRRRAALLNPIALKRGLDEARGRLLKLSAIDSSIPSSRVS